ncbi:ribosome biogenesis GTPase Der [[Mycoplasma] mobile]|uniref:GTPase Der n=1 Tax=Mycoplasma mobile (strain ATCC 43663 / 163K / NCTC 11711) TaxID=267748 RepID=Q6KHG1_MYCM1|nr:ribosome biogenesis GTPase Der [[Mycoplasma] mobile]AAT27969.1 predicted GTPase protein [Mycoplasma mobile 163K]
MSKLIAIVGKPNVGKSTIFNRIIGKRQAVVADIPGVTRDRLYEKATWDGKTFEVVDTGGIQIEDVPFQKQIKIQAMIAIEEADVIIFVVEGRSELSKDDYLIVDILRKSNKQIFFVANKLEDNHEFDHSLYKLGFDKIFKISALHGEGIGDLLEACTKTFPKDENIEDKDFKIAIIGKPNAGKSSLLNTILDEERSIVSPIPGTTHDPISESFYYKDEKLKIIDTAGIIKKSRMADDIDFYILNRAFKTIEESNLVLLILDASLGSTHFDATIAGTSFEQNKPIIIVVNKWDLIEKNEKTMEEFTKKIRAQFHFLFWAPIVFISALEGLRINTLLDKVLLVKANSERVLNNNVLNDILLQTQAIQPAPTHKGGKLQIKYIRQIKGNTPTFLFFVNNKRFLHFSYLRFIQNQLRQHFSFEGVPIVTLFRDKFD